MANWSQCKEFPKIKQKKGEKIINRNAIKRTEFNKTSKPATLDLSFAAALSGAQNGNKKPETSASTEEAPKINENNSKENYFGLKRRDHRVKKILPRLPLPLGNGKAVQELKR
ncbi:hypothetical protein TNCV_547591 [Trichonephila clavipes]|nr:hypothetical protein TNCV_547591 [Trichonephila clavipes]